MFIYWKCPAENAGNDISGTLNSKSQATPQLNTWQDNRVDELFNRRFNFWYSYSPMQTN